MDLTQLEYFRTIAEAGSMTRAAEMLHTSQPALSAMVKRLERELDAELFDRTPNRARLNGAGETVLAHVHNILREAEEMKKDLRRYAQRDNALSIAFCDPGVQWYCVPRFSYVYPDIQVSSRLCGENALRLLLERECDIAVVPEKIMHSEVLNLPFLQDQVYLSAPAGSSFLDRESISLRELPAQPLLLPTFGGYFTETIEKIIMEERQDIAIVKNDFPVMQHMVRTTNFLSTISTLSMELRNDGENRRFLPLNDPEMCIAYQAAYLKGSRGAAGRFLEWAKKCAGEQRAGLGKQQAE